MVGGEDTAGADCRTLAIGFCVGVVFVSGGAEKLELDEPTGRTDGLGGES